VAAGNLATPSRLAPGPDRDREACPKGFDEPPAAALRTASGAN